jgi:hypothetical protein
VRTVVLAAAKTRYSSDPRASDSTFRLAVPKIHDVLLLAMIEAIGPHVVAGHRARVHMIVSRPRVGQVVADAGAAGLRLNQGGNFICAFLRSRN